jgi:hypothetical protein
MLRVDQQDTVGVRVSVYKSRRDRQSRRVDDATRFGIGQIADGGYSPTVYSHVRPESAPAAAVNYGSAGNDYVKHG